MVSFSCICVCGLKHTKHVENVKNRIKTLISKFCISLVYVTYLHLNLLIFLSLNLFIALSLYLFNSSSLYLFIFISSFLLSISLS